MAWAFGISTSSIGKQGWKILTNPDAIISRVFNAKYFPIGDLLGTSIGHNPSYVWRSICALRVVVKGGLRWRVDDGSNIRIWDDIWHRDSKHPFVTFGLHLSTNLCFVSYLVDQASNE